MPQLKASERRLLTLFGVVILGLFTYFFVFEYLVREFKRVKLENQGLVQELTEERAMMARASETLPKRDWLDSTQPAAPDYILGAERLERFVVNSAEREGLQLTDIGSVGEEIETYYHSVFMDVEARGDIDAIVRWLSVLQDQDAFRAVTKCEIQPVQRKEPAVLKCEARIEQWYARPASALAMSGPPPARFQDAPPTEEDTGPPSAAEAEEEMEAEEEATGGEGEAGAEDESGEEGEAGGEEASPRRVLLPGAGRDGGRRPIAPPPVAPVDEEGTEEEGALEEGAMEEGALEEGAVEEGAVEEIYEETNEAGEAVPEGEEPGDSEPVEEGES